MRIDFPIAAGCSPVELNCKKYDKIPTEDEYRMQHNDAKALAEFMYRSCQVGFVREFLKCYKELDQYAN